MSATFREIERLSVGGWIAPVVDDQGVRDVARLGGQSLSYPDEGLDVLELDSGSGYWFDHRASAIYRALQSRGVSTLWDVGAGTGSVAARLAADGIDVVAVEPLVAGAQAAAARGVPALRGTLDELRLPDASLPAVGMFDVIEHIAEPAPLLTEVSRVLQPGGLLVVTVPAFSWLWGSEDDVAGHCRRYTKTTLREEVTKEGFVALHAEYLFASLVPVAGLLRALPYRLGFKRSSEQVLDGLKGQLDPSPIVERALTDALRIEDRLSRRTTLPFGLSLLAVFRSAGA